MADRDVTIRLLLEVPDAKVPPPDTKAAESAIQKLTDTAVERMGELEAAAKKALGAVGDAPKLERAAEKVEKFSTEAQRSLDQLATAASRSTESLQSQIEDSIGSLLAGVEQIGNGVARMGISWLVLNESLNETDSAFKRVTGTILGSIGVAASSVQTLIGVSQSLNSVITLYRQLGAAAAASGASAGWHGLGQGWAGVGQGALRGLAIGGVAGVGVTLAGQAALNYYNGQNDEALERGRQLDAERDRRQRSGEATRARATSALQRGLLAGGAEFDLARARFGAGQIDEAELTRAAETRQSALEGASASLFDSAQTAFAKGSEDQAATLANAAKQAEQERLDVLRALTQERELEVQKQLESNALSQRQLEAEQERARAISARAGRLDDSSFAEGKAALERFQNAQGAGKEQAARDIERIFGAGGQASEYLDQIGQQRIDQLTPEQRALFGGKDSSELAALQEKLDETLKEREELMGRLSQFAVQMAEQTKAAIARMEAIQQYIDETLEPAQIMRGGAG